MSEYIEVGQPLQFTDPNTPTRVGEIVENVSDIYNIPSPRLGMQVFVKSEKKSFVITSLKNKVIGGVDVPEAAVEAFELVGAKSITWNNDNDPSNMNDFVVAGVYDIKGEHKRKDDNLPILNTGGGHSFNARLTVLDSSISGSGKDDDKCITQVLSFSNRLGQGEIYIRTGKGSSLNNLTWEKWSTLQRNMNVGEVGSLDDLKDNGIYSGVWLQGHYNSYPITFVCVVINDYFIGTAPRRISQFVYGLSKFDGSVVYQSRVWDDSKDKWSNWEILNKNEIDSMITDAVDAATKAFNSRIDNLIDGAPETLDTLKEIADWVNTHEDLYQFLESIVELNTQSIEDEKTRAENAEKDIKRKAVDVETLNASALQDKVDVYFRNLNGVPNGFTIPAATTESAGVMSAADKVTLDNCKIIDIENEDLAIEEGFYSSRHRNNVSFYIIVQVKPLANRVLNITQYKFIGGNVLTRYATTSPTIEITWTDWVFVNKEEVDELINQSAEYVQNTLLAEIDKLKDGDTIVGQAREIHSRNGKTVPDSFLARTTAGSGTIGDGVASLKRVGGNIVKNLGYDNIVPNSVLNQSVAGGEPIWQLRVLNETQAVYRHPIGNLISSHLYYIKYYIYTNYSANNSITLGGGGYSSNRFMVITSSKVALNQWQNVSNVLTYNPEDGFVSKGFNTLYPFGTTAVSIDTYAYITTPIFIDLTEMFSAGKEPNKATCDKLFGTMDALPQGLTIANPTVFTSIGFNHFNSENVLEGKAIVDNAIVPGDKKIAVIPCLPCKVGVGENNGYCIHGDFGEDIKVYLTPLNPMEVDGELYMHELTKDATTDTYVPLIKGYMLVEVPTTANLCAHFLWSEDKCERDSYEPYFESKIELPVIPQMSEWGLAGIQSSGTLVCDEIDLERGVYVKRIEKILLRTKRFFDQSANRFYIDLGSAYTSAKANNLVCNAYTVTSFNSVSQENMTIMSTGRFVYIKNERYSTAAELSASFTDECIYVVLPTPEEYPLPKVENNYISSDYGVEQFDSVVPCNANNLYYMRSLAGETRNFLDRLMAGLGTGDATVVADRILAVVNPAVEPANVEPETLIEE